MCKRLVTGGECYKLSLATRSFDLWVHVVASRGRNFRRVGSKSGAENERGQTQNVMKYEKFDCLVTIKFLMFVEL